jgi:hypothetical protein
MKILEEKIQNKINNKYIMKPTSIFKEYAKKTHSKSSEKKISAGYPKNPINVKSYIELESAYKEDKFDVNYNIEDYIDTDLNNISDNVTHIVFCVYRISYDQNYKNTKYPYLQYLLYKYPKDNDKISNLMTFPFIKKENGSKIEKTANKYLKNLFGVTRKIKGFIENNRTVYLFINYNPDNTPIKLIYKKSSEQSFWWVIIDNICNKKRLLNFPIHSSVYKFFYKNQFLIYLLYNNKKIPIPTSLFYGDNYNYIKNLISLGEKKSKKLILTNFTNSFKYGAWDHSLDKTDADTDIDGKYAEGGIMEFAAFIENNSSFNFNINIDLLNLLENNKKLEYPLGFSSVSIGGKENYNVKPEFWDTLDNKHLTPIAFYQIDKKSLPYLWSPSYENYNII